LALLATLPGGYKEEREIHEKFAHLRFDRTEQFAPATELMEFIGKPLLVAADPDAVEVMVSRSRIIASLKGSDECEAWLDNLVRATESGTRSNAVLRALRVFARSQGFKEPLPSR
jgi:hypothetical protein